MREKIIILGAGVMQGPAIRIAKELGFFTVAVDGDSSAPNVALADQFEQIDLKDKEGIEAFARSLQNNGNCRSSGTVSGIMTAGTDFSATVAWVAEKLGLPGIPYESALNASDKTRMRSCFKKACLPSPEFVTITAKNLEIPDKFEFLPRRNTEFDTELHGEKKTENNNSAILRAPSVTSVVNIPPFPLVIKPVDNMGGRGCRRVNSIEEFREAAEDALRFSRSGRAIAEAYMEGPEFSVDAIVYHGEITICGLADRHIFFPPYFIEMGHTMPTCFPPEQQKALLETFCEGVHALGLAGPESIGAAKGDIKLTPQGPQLTGQPMIGEIAARLSGGYMSGWTYPYSSGVEPIRAAVLAATGRKPDGLIPLRNWTCAERAFISIPGTVRAITGTEAARNIPHVRDLFLRAKEGGKVSFPVNNVSKCGNIISAAPDRTAAVEAAENAARAVLIRLDPSDNETETFLSSPQGIFPPDAFRLSAELRASLEKLPETAISTTQKDGIFLVSFPEFTGAGLTDYVGRTVGESLRVIRELTSLSLQEITQKSAGFSDNKYSFLGRSFWAALVRGGYQGAVYYIDKMRIKNEK